MEQSLISPDMLEHANCGAFVVENGVVTQANSAASSHQICIGTNITDYICVGAEEYAAFTTGKLCLCLNVCGANINATVVGQGNLQMFYLESDFEEPELRAFALAAQHLREPLANALTSANELASQGAQEMQEQLAQLNKNLYRLHRAICNMSDAAQYHNQRPSRMEYREITSIFTEIMEKATQHLSCADHKLTYHAPDERINTIIDAEKLERALLNLISNMVKFAPQDSEVHAELHRTGDKLYFTFRNDGDSACGNRHNNIFSHYLREPGIENPKNGIGLGMSLVQKAAASHGGTLLMQQSDDQGICLTMTIPIKANKTVKLRSNVRLPVDYAGGYDHTLIELSDVLPTKLYE